MKTEQEQIGEMAKDLEEAKYYALGTVGSLNNGFGGWYGAYMYKKGYRKASDVIDEVISSVKSIIKTAQMCKDVFLSIENYEWLWNRLDELAAKMRQEVEK